jgi:hypothetical protein
MWSNLGASFNSVPVFGSEQTAIDKEVFANRLRQGSSKSLLSAIINSDLAT